MDSDSEKYVDVAIESMGSMWYRFEDVRLDVLTAAVNRALSDETTLSMLNSEGAALVIPWRNVRSVNSADVDEMIDVEDGEDPEDLRTWSLVWERTDPVQVEPAPVFQ